MKIRPTLPGLLVALAISLSGQPVASATVTPSIIQYPVIAKSAEALLSSPSRPEADRAHDASRKPLELLALVSLTKGAMVADLIPGNGYFTRLLSLEVGTSGHVYAVIPAEMAARNPEITQTATNLATNPSFTNVSVVVTPVVDFHVPRPLDLVWTSQNYHDIYGAMGAESAQRMDRAIFQALKPGGVYMIIDHVALPGFGTSAATALHRIDPSVIISQVESVGFELETTSPILHNPDDTHTLSIFDKAVADRTDQAVLVFRKPLKQGDAG